jgi:hypothetical protein
MKNKIRQGKADRALGHSRHFTTHHEQERAPKASMTKRAEPGGRKVERRQRMYITSSRPPPNESGPDASLGPKDEADLSNAATALHLLDR